ncbi:hypothetical protein HRD49_06070 [Corallococcus exiguus]|uniref:hypothetical protein n=1 Tax=Corallococcus TaxID=83461 RepID=UPI000EE7B946|nr:MULTISPECIES: hypothetical protein [Corallococcus]NRD52414.1 hypothetical protein [Corallococcus exiguus]NRD61312.1 hypothetical protein [Corallococcus exiguus]RKI15752.1 hypothetical protein D7Y15_13165 [Corallococcus sp. AB030]
MHPRRPDIDAALTDLRNRLPGGKIVDHWHSEPPWPTPEQLRLRDAWFDSLAEALEMALTRQDFVPIVIPEARSPPDWEFILAHALARHSGPVASYPHFSETRRKEGEPVITLGTAFDELVIFQGPLELHGHVDLRGTVVVLGDLIIHGALMDGDPADSGLVVIGNERVCALSAGADHVVTGDMDAELLVPSGSEGSLAVGGEVRVRLRLKNSTAGEEERRWLEPVPSDEVLEDGWTLCREVGSGRTKVRPPP